MNDGQSIAEAVEKLKAWWSDQAAAEIEKLAPKAIEYGGADLKVMAAAMKALWPDPASKEAMPEKVFVEMAIAFYTLGKVARLFGAYEQGRLPSDDTWEDLAIYPRMALRVREAGGWPS